MLVTKVIFREFILAVGLVLAYVMQQFNFVHQSKINFCKNLVLQIYPSFCKSAKISGTLFVSINA